VDDVVEAAVCALALAVVRRAVPKPATTHIREIRFFIILPKYWVTVNIVITSRTVKTGTSDPDSRRTGLPLMVGRNSSLGYSTSGAEEEVRASLDANPASATPVTKPAT
jgi:hypothetical protein